MVRARWPKFIRKPKLRLSKPSLKMPQRPSNSTVFILTLVFVLFIYSGGIWDLVFRERLRSMGADIYNQPILIYPGLDFQYLLEGLVASILVFVGFMGIVILYQSTRHVYRPTYARLLLVSGVALAFTSYILLYVMLSAKFPT